MKLLVSCIHLQRRIEDFRDALESRGVSLVIPRIAGQQLSLAEVQTLFGEGINVAILGDDPVDNVAIELGKRNGLRAIVKWGIGTDAIDKLAAKTAGIPVYNTPGAFGEEVADLAMAHMLLLARPLHRMDQSVRSGGWQQIQGRSLSGLTGGIIGLGSIGRAIGCRLCGFGIAPLGYDTFPPTAAELAGVNIKLVDLDTVFIESDILFLACALSPENYHLVNTHRFAQMKPGAYLINVARGPLVDEAALTAALTDGKLAGAGLDVYEVEPLPEESPLRRFDNVILGSHCGSNTTEAVSRINSKTVRMALHLLGIETAVDLSSFNRVA